MKMLSVVLKNLFSPPVTRKYPQENRSPFPATRGEIVFTVEECMTCRRCERTCPVGAIKVEIGPRLEVASASEGQTRSAGRLIKRRYDPYKCIYCGLCIEVCPQGIIVFQGTHTSPATRKEEKVAVYTLGARKPAVRPVEEKKGAAMN
ncbi:4Fe-4S dicluster domain-containing protein [Ammonifex thiophilus]|uniref:4Fe-4S dicluster domain-containing protein n=1 Tax=Ammonifex thiophilus TaxID=444093 RepID=A0A3D8P348_9THEO|nr:4Fe-4S dicluster domain-containing protein [Ammonifex thiophilus]RDV83016.1 4Fe-4S dicluster domain-containing protein [Ammonifex thiophilus]